MLADKLNLVKKNIEEACDTAGRSPQEVTLIAVSKTKPCLLYTSPSPRDA